MLNIEFLFAALVLSSAPSDDLDDCAVLAAIKVYVGARLSDQDRPYAETWLVESRSNAPRLRGLSCIASGIKVLRVTSSPDAGREKVLVFSSHVTSEGIRFDLTTGTTEPNVNYFGVLVTGLLKKDSRGTWLVEEIPLGKPLGYKPPKTRRAASDAGP